MTEKILVDAREIGCTYHLGETAIEALKSATCQVRPGERIALVGPSGSGKSTLLQALGGLEVPTEGSITWPLLGNRNTLRPKQVGFIFQMQSLISSLTVVENVELPLLLTKAMPKQVRQTALAELERLELLHLADKLPEELSGGQAQRVAVARVLACRPRLILADEPTGQLDHPTAYHLFDELFSALGSTDTALVVSTHDLGIARRLDTVWRIEQGRLELNH
ncbi:MAG: ABC transporter ATP-binding protein [Desulfitobacteriaceae bacterium]